MSGYVHEEVSTVATQFDAFIRKPFKPTEVLEQANALLTGSNEAS
jgi:DNA-binding response OmpR family regulator